MTNEEIQEQTEEVLAQVQEFIEPDDQPIYPNLPPTLEEFRSLLQALETPDGQIYYQVDLNMLPEGMTPQDYVTAHTDHLGIMPIGTRFVVGNDPITTQPQVVPVVEEVTVEPELTFGPQLPSLEQQEARRKKEDEELERQRVEHKKRDDDYRLKLKRERARKIDHRNYHIKPDEIMLVEGYRDGIGMARFDTIEGTIAEHASSHTVGCERSGNSKRLLTSSLILDKNMNSLIPDYSFYDETTNVDINVIDTRHSNLGSSYLWDPKKKWIIIDKYAFLSSGGKEFKLKSRHGYTMEETLKVKRKVDSIVKEAEEFITHLKNLVNGIYDEENFEILYDLKFSESGTNNFEVYIQFPNLEVSNSIELTHTIENLIVKMTGTHHYGIGMEKNSMVINQGLDGLRTSFSPEDAYYGYRHSHLPSNSIFFEDFCMGSNHFMSHIPSGLTTYTSDIDFEMMMIAAFDHVSWESLEGGPYTKMEDIGNTNGSPVNAERQILLSGSYARSEYRWIMNNLKNMDMSSLMDAFELKLKSNGEVTYETDRVKFIRNLGKLTEDIMFELSREEGTTLYVYNPSTDKFTRGSDTSNPTPENWAQLIRQAEEKIEDIPSVYMNGDYIIPKLVNTNVPQKAIVRMWNVPHPTFIKYLEGIIKYHLLNELKNVKK